MNIVDTNKLALFHEQLARLASDCEENWYLVKRILNEMDLDDLYENPFVEQELRAALSKLERMMEVLQGMKQITKSLSDDYVEIASRHQKILDQMSEYAVGLRATYQMLGDENHPEMIPIQYTSTAPIHLSIQENYGKMQVIKDE